MPRARRPPARHGAWRARARAATSARSAGSSTPSSSASPQPLGRLVEGQGPRRRSARRGRCRRWPRSVPASGAAAVKWCASSAAPRATARLQRLADAQMQLRAAQAGEPVTCSARRTSSCAKRYVEPHRRQLLDHPAAHGLVERRPGRPRSPRPLRAGRRAPNSEPATAASSSRSLVAGRSRASRPPTTSRTLSGVPSSASGRTSRSSPSTISRTFVSTIARHSSQTRNALPAVRSLIVPASSGTSPWAPARRTKSVAGPRTGR